MRHFHAVIYRMKLPWSDLVDGGAMTTAPIGGPGGAVRLGIAALLFSSLACVAPARAADEATLAGARQCAAIRQQGEGIAARDQWYRKRVRCLKNLYVAVSLPGADAATAEELHARLDALERAYHDSRSCLLLERDCGTISPSPAEFVTLLKTMIVNEDAGWVRADPRLEEALTLTENGTSRP